MARFDFLAGGGEMGARIREFDWAGTPIGAPDTWPQGLRAAVRLLLNTGHPMFIWWGPDLIQFYNDAYSQTMGPERHPSALGQRGRACWEEIWPIIGPQIDYVMAGQGSTWDVERLVPVTRHGRREDVWWTYSYGPIDHDGEVGGVLVVCTDVTEQHRAKQSLADQSRRLEQLFEQAPGFMAVLRGPTHVFELANAAYRRLVGGRDVAGKSVREALPEVESQGFLDLLDRVYRTGEAYIGRRIPITIGQPGMPPRLAHLDFVYQPIVEADGSVSGIFVEGVDVTDHVRSETHLQLVNEELKHRVKNTLAMVSAIANQTLGDSAADGRLDSFYQRLSIFAKAHDILTANAWATAQLGDVVRAALAAHGGESARITVNGPDITIGAKQALSLALAVHELATNASKYGALSGEHGTVSVTWEAGNATTPLRFRWRESDGPPVSPPTRKGFGSRLIERVLRDDFGGEVEVRYDPEGLICELRAPVEKLDSAMPSPFAAMQSA